MKLTVRKQPNEKGPFVRDTPHFNCMVCCEQIKAGERYYTVGQHTHNRRHIKCARLPYKSWRQAKRVQQ